jgi:hypothetical protein
MDLITLILACSMYPNNSITNAMVQIGSQNKPYSIAVDGAKPQTFTSASAATVFANKQLAQNHKIEVGIMQIPDSWFKEYNVTAADLLLPCKNVVVATEILNEAASQCADLQSNNPNLDVKACTLSIYKSGDPQNGSDYATKITDYASVHNFDKILADAKAKNPKEFSMLPGDVATTISTPNAAKVNPATDPKRRLLKHVEDDTADNSSVSNDTNATPNVAPAPTTADNSNSNNNPPLAIDNSKNASDNANSVATNSTNINDVTTTADNSKSNTNNSALTTAIANNEIDSTDTTTQ